MAKTFAERQIPSLVFSLAFPHLHHRPDQYLVESVNTMDHLLLLPGAAADDHIIDKKNFWRLHHLLALFLVALALWERTRLATTISNWIGTESEQNV